jgi:hypothetical protein
MGTTTMILRYNPQLLLADPLAIPAFLKIPQAQRAQSWVRNPPRVMVHTEAWQRSETRRLYDLSIEHDKAVARARNEQRWAALKAQRDADKAERDAVKLAVQKSKRSSSREK